MTDDMTENLWIVAPDGEVIDVVDSEIVANEIVKYHQDDEELTIYTEKAYEELYGDILVINDADGEIVARFLDEDDAMNFIMEYPTEDQLFIYTQNEYDKSPGADT